MDEDAEGYVTIEPMRHDKFSALIPLFNLAASVIENTGSTVRMYTLMIAQHAEQIEYDRRFERMLK